MVLLIACANTANLLLARAAARQPEFAMRLAVGAGRPRLVRQLLVESVALSVTAGACGILLARWATRLLVLYISSGRAPVVLDLHPDLRVLAFTAAVSIATGILFGLAPAVRATRPVPSRTQPRGALRPGAVLAVVQVALSLVLLIGAGLFVRSLENLVSAQPADAESILIVRVEPKGSDQRNIPGTTQRLDRIYQGLIQRVESIPGVRSASLAQFTPTSHRGNTVQVDLPSGERRPVYLPMVYPGYFRTLGIPIVAGRDFSAADIAENAPRRSS
jgi:hypothetical protein